MQRYAIVDTATGAVINVIEYETPPGNPPPGFGAGIIAVQHDTADTRWTWDGTQLVPPHVEPGPTPPPPPPDANERLDAGINASIAAADAVRNSIHAIPSGFTAANFQAFLVQAKILSDAFVAMLEAQQTPP